MIALYAALKETAKLRGAAIVMALACTAGLGIGWRIDRVRLAIAGPIDALAVDDPRRIAFGRLHASSVALLGAAMVAALVIVIAAVFAWRSNGQYSH
jgi:hypothetical protein